jgi:hypothetical protein
MGDNKLKVVLQVTVVMDEMDSPDEEENAVIAQEIVEGLIRKHWDANAEVTCVDYEVQ